MPRKPAPNSLPSTSANRVFAQANPASFVPKTKTPNEFYRSPEWRALVSRLLEERGRRCECCGRVEGPLGQPLRIFGDHIRELRDGGAPLDPLNIRLLCGSCHGKKTELARRIRFSKRA